MIELSLIRRANPLADPSAQLRVLDERCGEASFVRKLAEHGAAPLQATGIDVLQVNVGKLCNQTCQHCHVDAGPDRREAMSREVADACLAVLAQSDIPTLDITGGAPEMNPQFRSLVRAARALSRRVIDRCNLTILVANGYEDLAEFLAEQRVEIVASLPCYLAQNVDRQRGDQAFARSIAALRKLNELGYGRDDSPLELTLVYNPTGPSLPPPQEQLETAYRTELRTRYGIEFTRLFTITNMPISRFLDDLLSRGKLDEYLRKLTDAFNPTTLAGVMCRSTLSVDWRGRLYDCDFNQMLELPVVGGLPRTVFELDEAGLAKLADRRIATGPHCFGCTAGAGSSCQGSLAR